VIRNIYFLACELDHIFKHNMIYVSWVYYWFELWD